MASGFVVTEHRISARDGLILACRETSPTVRPDRHRAPLLCLPGLARNADDFDGFAQRIAVRHRRRVFAVDYRGRGNSEWDVSADNYRPEQYLNDLRNLMAGLGLHHVVAVGTSMGGALAMAMGVAMPGALAGVVLNDIGPRINGSGLDKILDYLSNPPEFDDWSAAVAHIRGILPNLSVPDEAGWDAVARGTFRQAADGRFRVAWDKRIVEPLRKRGPMPDLWPYFRSLRRIPTLAIRGGVSDILGADTLAEMAATVPSLRAVTVPGQGHAPLLNEPECKEAIDEFLRTAC